MKSRMMIGFLVIAIAAAVIGGATMAIFWDTDAIEEPVQFTAGTLLIGLDVGDEWDSNRENFDPGLLNPGDKWCNDIYVLNEGTKNMKFRGCFFDIEQWTGDDPENPVTGADGDGQYELLSDRGYGDEFLTGGDNPLVWYVYIPLAWNDDADRYEPTFDGVPDGYIFHNFSEVAIAYFNAHVSTELCCDGEGIGYIIDPTDEINKYIFGEHYVPNNPFGPGEFIQYKVCFELPLEAGNEYQGGKIQGKIGFAGTQWLDHDTAPWPVCE